MLDNIHENPLFLRLKGRDYARKRWGGAAHWFDDSTHQAEKLAGFLFAFLLFRAIFTNPMRSVYGLAGWFGLLFLGVIVWRAYRQMRGAIWKRELREGRLIDLFMAMPPGEIADALVGAHLLPLWRARVFFPILWGLTGAGLTAACAMGETLGTIFMSGFGAEACWVIAIVLSSSVRLEVVDAYKKIGYSVRPGREVWRAEAAPVSIAGLCVLGGFLGLIIMTDFNHTTAAAKIIAIILAPPLLFAAAMLIYSRLTRRRQIARVAEAREFAAQSLRENLPRIIEEGLGGFREP